MQRSLVGNSQRAARLITQEPMVPNSGACRSPSHALVGAHAVEGVARVQGSVEQVAKSVEAGAARVVEAGGVQVSGAEIRAGAERSDRLVDEARVGNEAGPG
jgi:hypothetical protein